MRLIDADKLPKYTGYALSANEVAIAVENAPTIDAGPVVRCKECVKREICRTSNIWAVAPSDDWFCADGERKGGEE